MAFVWGFIKLLLTPRSRKNQSAATSEEAPASQSPIGKKRKSRSPSVVIPSIEDEGPGAISSAEGEELDIVPSIEINECAEMEMTTPSRKRRKTAHKKNKSDHVAGAPLNRLKRPPLDKPLDDVDGFEMSAPSKKKNTTHERNRPDHTSVAPFSGRKRPLPGEIIDDDNEIEMETPSKKRRKIDRGKTKTDHATVPTLDQHERSPGEHLGVESWTEDMEHPRNRAIAESPGYSPVNSTGDLESKSRSSISPQLTFRPGDVEGEDVSGLGKECVSKDPPASPSKPLPPSHLSISLLSNLSANGESDSSTTSPPSDSFIVSTDNSSATSISRPFDHNPRTAHGNNIQISSKVFENTSDHAYKNEVEVQDIAAASMPFPPPTPSSSSTKLQGQTSRPVDWSSPSSVTRERAVREAQIAQKTAGWRPADAEVYREIRLRPLKATLPPGWKKDFSGFPEGIFATSENVAYIKPRRLRKGGVPDFSGPHALKKVFNSGIDVQTALLHGESPSKHIKKATESFIRWTLEDVGLRKQRAHLPLIEIQVGSEDEAVPDTQKKLVKKMQELKSKWASAIEDNDNTVCPPIYGILISHCVEAFIAPVDAEGFGLDGNEAMNDCRVLAILDWSQGDQDIWNALALAILAVHSRDILLEFLDGRTLKDVEVEMEPLDVEA